ncbi:MAG: type I-E CRISPR-associated protein Cas7/Cse4/CasC [Mycobacterium sp.]|nr:type I-E CRISPR-associated protein Cas7/Cse4/CasC [Mycobacterium sp.]
MVTHIEVHVLQALPPSNVNRDGDGSPKSARYGGKRRARVSSQSWKRATRLTFPDSDQGVRTKMLADAVAKHLCAQHGYTPENASDAALQALATAGIGGGKGKETATGQLRYLLLFGEDLPAKIAQAVVDKALTKDSAKELIRTAEKPLSLALFGRMIADDKSLSVDAACQVAHAISTHETASELDYYTAVDDLRTDDAGAGMIGEIGYQSAVLYRYANINMDLLAANLNGSKADAVEGVEKFIGSFVTSMPSGYGNSTAPGTLPKLVTVVIRERQRPVNLADAFENPVTADGGFIDPSAKRLAAEYESVASWMGEAPTVVAHRLTGDTATAVEKAFGPNHTLRALIDKVGSNLNAA